MRHRSIPRFAPVIVIVLVAAAAYLYWNSVRGGESAGITASGTIEAPEVLVGPELAGRVVEVAVEEGQTVQPGDLLFRLDDDLLAAQRQRTAAALEVARAAVEVAEVGLRSAELQVQIALDAARLEALAAGGPLSAALQPSAFELPSWYYSDSETLAAAEASVKATEESLALAQWNLRDVLQDEGALPLIDAESRVARAEEAYRTADQVLKAAQAGGASQELLDEARSRFDAASDELDAAQSALDDLLDEPSLQAVLEARARLAVAKAAHDAALIRAAGLRTAERSPQVQAAGLRVEQAEAAVLQAEKAVAQVETELRLIDLQLEKTRVVAPIAGVVLTRSVEVGEVLQPGAGAIRLGRLDELTLRVFVAEDRFGQIRLGDRAQVTVDSFPGERFEATVLRVADEAEFTPRNVQTEEGRRTTVFEVELSVKDPDSKLKPGMPADVSFASP